jgi:hypothetical protein
MFTCSLLGNTLDYSGLAVKSAVSKPVDAVFGGSWVAVESGFGVRKRDFGGCSQELKKFK